MENITNWLSENGVDWGIKIAVAIAIFVIGKMLARFVAGLVKKALARSGTDSMVVNFLGTIIYTILIIAVILAAVDTLGIDVTSLLAIVGVAGLAVGLALKDSLSNFAAGVMIIIFRPFKIGDFITAGGASGVVDEISLFNTLMHTGDNQRIIVPNSAILDSNIINVSALPTRRVDLVIGIGYDDNIGQARDIIMGILESDERVLEDPAPAVAVGELGDSSINLNVRPWANTADYWPLRAFLLEEIKVKLDDAGISIPFPQRDVHMHEVKSVA